MTEVELRNGIRQAIPMMKAPPELVEKGLMMARVFDKAVAEKRLQGKKADVKSVESPKRNLDGSGMIHM